MTADPHEETIHEALASHGNLTPIPHDSYLAALIALVKERDEALVRLAELEAALRATGLHALPRGVYADDWTEDVGVYVSPIALRKVVAALAASPSEETKP